MPTIKTTVETEKTRHRTGTFLAAESAPVLRGDGDIAYVCGGCGAVLIEDKTPGAEPGLDQLAIGIAFVLGLVRDDNCYCARTAGVTNEHVKPSFDQ